MIAWQVGDTTTSREWVADGSALLGGPPRIARVVLATAAAGCALEAGELERAAGLIHGALQDAVELGVDRELPLVQAVARASVLHAATSTALVTWRWRN